MSDCCTVSIHCAESDRGYWEDLHFHHDGEDDSGAILMYNEMVNWGSSSHQIEKAVADGKTFLATFGPGGCYGPETLVCKNGDVQTVPCCSESGLLMVGIDEQTGEPYPEHLQLAKRVLEMKKEIEAGFAREHSARENERVGG